MKYSLTKLLLMLAVISCWAQPKGKIVKIDGFKSKFVQARTIEIWLPAGYDANPKTTYPVLYMQDGQSVFNAKTAIHKVAWQADLTAEKLTAVTRIEPVIIVAVWSSDNRYMEYFPEKAALNFSPSDREIFDRASKEANPNGTGFLADKYLSFLTKELKPYIDKQYRTKPDAKNTAICGGSMGAVISLYALCEYPDVFGKAACVSTHWPLLPDNANGSIANSFKKYIYEKLPSAENHKVYFDYGTKTLDQYYEPHQKTIDGIMKMKGYTSDNWTSKKFEGAAHVEKAWQDRFNEVLFFLFKNEDKKGKNKPKTTTAKGS